MKGFDFSIWRHSRSVKPCKPRSLESTQSQQLRHGPACATDVPALLSTYHVIDLGRWHGLALLLWGMACGVWTCACVRGGSILSMEPAGVLPPTLHYQLNSAPGGGADWSAPLDIMASRVLRTQLMGVACCRALQAWPCCVRPKFQELCSSQCQGTALNRAACSSRAEILSYCLVFGTEVQEGSRNLVNLLPQAATDAPQLQHSVLRTWRSWRAHMPVLAAQRLLQQ